MASGVNGMMMSLIPPLQTGWTQMTTGNDTLQIIINHIAIIIEEEEIILPIIRLLQAMAPIPIIVTPINVLLLPTQKMLLSTLTIKILILTPETKDIIIPRIIIIRTLILIIFIDIIISMTARK